VHAQMANNAENDSVVLAWNPERVAAYDIQRLQVATAKQPHAVSHHCFPLLWVVLRCAKCTADTVWGLNWFTSVP